MLREKGTTVATTDRKHEALFADLAARLSGELLRPDDSPYEAARQLWNGRVTARPAALVRCRTAEDVIATVQWVRAHDLPLSVRGGGHDFAGRALCEGVMIDCSLMNAVTVDPARCTARVEGGATAGDLIGAAHHYGLVTTTGTNSTVGMAGFTLECAGGRRRHSTGDRQQQPGAVNETTQVYLPFVMQQASSRAPYNARTQ